MPWSDNIYKISSYIYNSNELPKSFSSISTPEIINIGNALTAILHKEKNIEIDIPQLVVVGTQSSGKSSLLNGIIGMDILPTGSNMVTRTPLNLQLIQNSRPRLEFGNYVNGKWQTENTISLTLPIPTISESLTTKKEIIKRTKMLAGTEKSISHQTINIKIYAPNLPNLGLIDLPGLTMVACTDKGQPKNIKEQIRNMVATYIKNTKSIILAVMPARTDLEADPSLEFIKEFDNTGERTIGILTKIDLMNKDTDVTKYLENNISKDLKLKYGYFAIKNRSPKEMEDINILNGIQNEKKFFDNHPKYYGVNHLKRTGVGNLSHFLSKILTQHIKRSLPSVKLEINKLHNVINKKYNNLGVALPKNKESMVSLIHQLISNFSTNFTKRIENKKAYKNIGLKIKQILIDFRNKIDNIKPFKNLNDQDKNIQSAIQKCEGNHMNFLTPPIEVLELCLQDDNFGNPFKFLITPSEETLLKINSELYSVAIDILKEETYTRFPNLVNIIKQEFENIIKKNKIDTSSNIINSINMEKEYVWTDDPEFLDIMPELITNINTKQNQSINTLLEKYFLCIKKIIKNNIPKIIMMHFVRKTEQNINYILLDKIIKNPPEFILEEKNNISQLRNKYLKQLKNIKEAKKIIENI